MMYSNFYQPQSLLRVNGIEGAKAYPMQMPNSMVALFDNNEDVFYVKNTDCSGFSTVKAYSFTPIEEKPLNEPNTKPQEYVTRKEFEELKEAIYEQFNISKSTKKSTTSKSTANADD